MAQELRIAVTDRDGALTFVPCLRKIRGAQLLIVAATDINHWIEPSLVVNSRETSNIGPFGIGSGDCLFKGTTLFFFAGARNAASDNLLMLLFIFPVMPKAGSSGFGTLNTPLQPGSWSAAISHGRSASSIPRKSLYGRRGHVPVKTGPNQRHRLGQCKRGRSWTWLRSSNAIEFTDFWTRIKP
jgi:hypothetical protein